jgi:DNA modification methylase
MLSAFLFKSLILFKLKQTNIFNKIKRDFRKGSVFIFNFADFNNKILCGDALDILKQLPSNFFNTCITSPPYYCLRDYGTATWEGGDPNCDHKQYLGEHWEKSKKQITSAGTQQYNYSHVCKKCGAIRIDKQIGIEETPEEYVERLVDVFREVKRVLRNDGTCWLNLGDSWAGSNQGAGTSKHNPKQESNRGTLFMHEEGYKSKLSKISGYKPKDLIGIPWMVAFALRNDGWYLRQDIIWAKGNPMPESVRDRCTKSHEYIFLLSKSNKYYFDNNAIKEDAVCGKDLGILKSKKQAICNHPSIIKRQNENINSTTAGDGKRNKRDVWFVNTKPFRGAHFATFPPKLIEPCILAGCPENGIVLDPFIGSGTTGMVAKQLKRNYTGIDINPNYKAIQEARII